MYCCYFFCCFFASFGGEKIKEEMESDLMDLSSLIRLKEALEGSNSNTSTMIYKLKDFDSRLLSLDKKMLPIQNVRNRTRTFSFFLSLNLSFFLIYLFF